MRGGGRIAEVLCSSPVPGLPVGLSNRSSAPSSRPPRYRETRRRATSRRARPPSRPPPAHARTRRQASPGCGPTPHLMMGRDQLRDQPPTDITRRPRNQHATTAVHSRPARRRNEDTNRSGSARVSVMPGMTKRADRHEPRYRLAQEHADATVGCRTERESTVDERPAARSP